MSVTGGTTPHGIPLFADSDSPDLNGNLGGILATLDALIGVYKIADTTLLAPAATIDFSAIPQTFAHLLQVSFLRSTFAATALGDLLRLNNDSGANYFSAQLKGDGTTTSSTNSGAGGSSTANLGAVPGATADAATFAAILTLIPNYRDPVNLKPFFSLFSTHVTGATWNFGMYAGIWAGAAAAVNRITLLDGGANHAVGSRSTLYGLA